MATIQIPLHFMNTKPILTLLATLNRRTEKFSLENLITSQANSSVKEETLLGLANPVFALVENILDQMIIT